VDGIERSDCEIRLERVRGFANNGGLLLPVGADFIERCGTDPEARAARTFECLRGAKHDSAQRLTAARARPRRTIVFLGSLDFCPAMRTELGANENHAETRRTGDGSQTGAAMFARPSNAGAGRTAHWAIERRSFH